MLNFYLYRGQYVFFLSFVRGWGIRKIDIFSSHNSNSFFNQLFGFYKNFFVFLRLKGIGVRNFLVPRIGLGFIRVGFTHKISYSGFFRLKLVAISKQKLRIFSRDLLYMKEILQGFLTCFRRTRYKKKGIFLRGIFFKIKKSKKKSRF